MKPQLQFIFQPICFSQIYITLNTTSLLNNINEKCKALENPDLNESWWYNYSICLKKHCQNRRGGDIWDFVTGPVSKRARPVASSDFFLASRSLSFRGANQIIDNPHNRNFPRILKLSASWTRTKRTFIKSKKISIFLLFIMEN